jgi:hypothetical protein
MATDDYRTDLPVHAGRALRMARPWPVSDDPTSIGMIVGGIGTVILAAFVIARASTMYRDAGAASPEHEVGALIAQLLVVVALAAGVVFYRRGFSRRVVCLSAGVAGGLGVGFALLPYLVAHQSWLTVLLGIIVALFLDLVLTATAVVAALFLPLWWEPQPTAGEPNGNPPQ